MFKIWKVGTSVSSYIKLLGEQKYFGKKIEISRIQNNKGSVSIDGNIIVFNKDRSVIHQLIRVGIFTGLIKSSSKVTSVECILDGSREFFVNNLSQEIKVTIQNHIFDRSKLFFESVNNEEFFDDEFVAQEDGFIFSVMSTLISCHDSQMNKYVELQLDGTKVSDYSAWYKKFIEEYLIDNEKLLNLAINKLISSHSNVNDVLNFVSQSTIVPEDISFFSKSEHSLDNIIKPTKSNLASFIATHLSGEQYIKIPIYQRKYRWSTDNILQLVRDINSIDNVPNKHYHNIGSLIVKQDENANFLTIKIIDGQQRLTTMLIIMRAAYDVAMKNNFPIDRIVDDCFKRIDDNDSNASSGFIRVEGNEDFHSFRALLNGEKNSSKYATSITYRNYYTIIDWIVANISDADSMRKFWASLMCKTVFVKINYPTINEFELFEKLNTGSVPLNTLELIKNSILDDFNKIVDRNEKYFQEEFQKEILSHFESKAASSKGEIDEKKVKVYIISLLRVYGLEYDKSKSLYKQYRNIIETNYYSKISTIRNLKEFDLVIEMMKKDINIFNSITLLDEYKKTENIAHPFADYLFTFKGRLIYVPILFKLISEYSEKYKDDISTINKIRELLHVIETYEIRFQIVKYRGQSLGENMKEIANEISIDYSPRKLFENFESWQKGIKMPSKEEFVKQIKSHSFESNLATKVTVRIENYLYYNGIKYSNEWKPLLIDKKISHEHIMPQNRENWINEIIKNYKNDNLIEINNEYDNHVDKIGNAIPISKYKNSSLGNAGISEKMTNYLANEIVPSLKLFSGFEVKNENGNIISMKKIDDKFNFDAIENRTDAIAELCGVIWDDVL